MKRSVLTLVSCTATLPALAVDVTFTEVRYAGDDGGPAVGSTQYRNPVVAGVYPDHWVIRLGGDI